VKARQEAGGRRRIIRMLKEDFGFICLWADFFIFLDKNPTTRVK
jgi:hypothetical protein